MKNELQNSSIEVKHPGEFIKAMLEQNGMLQKELALRTGVSEKHISNVLNGEKGISASFARKLALVFGNEYSYWTNLQAAYDNHLLSLEVENDIKDEEKAVLKPLKELFNYCVENGFLHNDCSEAEKVLQWRKFLRISELTAAARITYNAAYRAQLKGNSAIDPYVLFAWQQLCERITDRVSNVAETLNTDLLYLRIDDIKKLTFEREPEVFRKELQAIFAECGIAFDVVRHFKGAPVQGFIKKTESGRNILCVTIRNGRADSFWFTLFHELGHILHGDLSMRFVDFPSVKGDVEEKADKFAQDALISPELFSAFVKTCDYRDINEIKNFARSANVPEFIVIGRLQKVELLDWADFARFIPMFKWEN